MKKLYFLLVSAIIMVALTACSNENSIVGDSNDIEMGIKDSVTDDAEQKAAFYELQQNIQNYNNRMFGIQQETYTRGFFKKFWRKLKMVFTVIGADAVGAGLGCINGSAIPVIGSIGGGIIGGVVASGATAAVLFANTDANKTPQLTRISSNYGFNPDSITFKNIVPSNDFIVKVKLDSVGFYHNKVLKNVFTNQVSFKTYANMSDDDKADIMLSEMKKEPYLVNYYGNELNNIENAKVGIKVADVMIKLENETETEEEFFNGLNEAGLTNPQIIAVLKDIITGLSQIDSATDDGTYYQEMLNIIENSNISDEAKWQLCNAVIVANASNHLWYLEPVTGPEIGGGGLLPLDPEAGLIEP